MRNDKEPGYEQRAKRAGKLDAFKSYVLGKIKAASPHRLPAPVLHRKIIALGYAGVINGTRWLLLTARERLQEKAEQASA